MLDWSRTILSPSQVWVVGVLGGHFVQKSNFFCLSLRLPSFLGLKITMVSTSPFGKTSVYEVLLALPISSCYIWCHKIFTQKNIAKVFVPLVALNSEKFIKESKLYMMLNIFPHKKFLTYCWIKPQSIEAKFLWSESSTSEIAGPGNCQCCRWTFCPTIQIV